MIMTRNGLRRMTPANQGIYSVFSFLRMNPNGVSRSYDDEVKKPEMKNRIGIRKMSKAPQIMSAISVDSSLTTIHHFFVKPL